jgi:ribonuclease R
LSNKKPKTTKAQQKRSAHAVIAKQPVRTRKPTDAEVAFASPVPTMPANAGNAPNRGSDPHATREAEKYEHPIPSRELIMDVLTQAGVPMMEDEIAAALEISEAEIDGFTRRLNAMERDGQVMKNRRGAIGLSEKMDLIAGRVQGHPDGFGFLVPDDKSEDLFLGPKQMQKVLDGDRVLVREIGVDRRGRREASIIEILEHKNTRVVGRLFEEHGVLFVVAENKRISQDILVEPGYDMKAAPGQVVMVELVAQPSKNSEPVARVIEVLGNYADPGMEIEIALRKHDLPYEWSDEILALEKKLPKKVTAKECEGRRDLRALPFVTIDGETAKDFDDAVYAEKQGKGYKLYVAIADVSHYVKQGNAIDREARLRGNSVYFPRRVIPMLPEALSNEMCSLNPRVDRLALVCEMQISAQGEVKRYDFYEAVFHSQQRLTYTKVAKYLYENETVYANEHGIEEKLLPHIRHLDEVFQILLAARHKRGAIDFESSETEMRFTEDGKISEIVPSKRNDAHRLIEECMLAANVSTANFLIEHEHPALYRVHEGPNEEKLAQVRGMLKDFGLSLGGGNDPSPSDYAALIVKIKGRPDEPLLNTVLLRSLRQAVYSPENVGHFGLSYEAYTHFTSPIRRYPDLLTHRAIKAILRNDVYDPKESWDALGQQCSMTERRADDATRDVVAWLKCYYMKDRLGETFAGTISSVTSFGIFVALDDVYVEGLVHISDLGQDYFKYDKDRHQIVGERTRKKYQLADRVNIKVVRVDIETSKIDFTLAAERIRSHAEIAAMDAPEYKPGLVSSAPKVAPALQTRQAGRASMAPTISSKLIEPPGAAPAATKKIVMTVSSANPPTTPLAGLDLGKPESRYAKAGRQTKLANAPKPIAPKAKKPSAGKSPAALSPSGVKPKGGAKAGARKSNAKSRQKS